MSPSDTRSPSFKSKLRDVDPRHFFFTDVKVGNSTEKSNKL